MLVGSLLSLTFVATASAATVTVNTSSDATVDGDCSLREAVQVLRTQANTAECVANETEVFGTNDTIVVDPDTNDLFMSVQGFDNSNTTGDIDITMDVVVDLSGNTLYVQGGPGVPGLAPSHRAFHIMGDVDVTIMNGVIEGGTGENDGPGDENVGGAVKNQGGTLLLQNVELTENTATWGGAVFNDNGGVTTLLDSTATLNEAEFGGALFNHRSGGRTNPVPSKMVLRNTDLTENEATSGGALFNNSGHAVIAEESVLMSNTAYQGGAIYNEADLNFIDLSVPDGVHGGRVYMSNSTMEDNQARNRFAGDDAQGGAVFTTGTFLVDRSKK